MQLHRIWTAIRGIDPNAANTWHVDSNVSASGAGKGWSNAFKTFAEALAVASAGDKIKVRGEFNESGLEIDIELTIEGQDISNNHYRTLFYSDDETPIFILKNNNLTLKNFGIAQQAAYPAIQIGDASGQAWYKLMLQNLKIDGWGTATSGVSFGHATVDAPDIHIDKCLFRSIAGTNIVSNATRGRYSENKILVGANYIGIDHQPDASSRPDTIIEDNLIVVSNSGDIGIKITNTPDAGKLIAHKNHIFNCATPITQKATNVAVQMNYQNDGAGGALIDPIA